MYLKIVYLKLIYLHRRDIDVIFLDFSMFSNTDLEKKGITHDITILTIYVALFFFILYWKMFHIKVECF